MGYPRQSGHEKRQIARIKAIAESGALEAGEIEQDEEIPQQLFPGFEPIDSSDRLEERKSRQLSEKAE